MTFTCPPPLMISTARCVAITGKYSQGFAEHVTPCPLNLHYSVLDIGYNQFLPNGLSHPHRPLLLRKAGGAGTETGTERQTTASSGGCTQRRLHSWTGRADCHLTVASVSRCSWVQARFIAEATLLLTVTSWWAHQTIHIKH